MKICIADISGSYAAPFRGAYLLGLHVDHLLSEVLYFIGSTTTAVPYAKTSVTPCMTSVAS
jgi:hypothetical protein